jgi:hypothetical protein
MYATGTTGKIGRMNTMSRRQMLLMISLGAAASSTVKAQQPLKIDVYKDPTCGCCANWVGHLRKNGFAVHSADVADISSVKAKYNVPAALRSCHTAVVGGYVIEGHVPAADIRRLLMTPPADVVGLAVPGMPVGSPGMEGSNPQAYQVLAFDKGGRSRIFATYR